jgi:uncharacterized membrane protein
VMRYRLSALAVAGLAAAVVLPAAPAMAAPGAAAARPAAPCTWRLDTRLPLPAGLTSASINATDGAADFAGAAWNFSVSDQFFAVVWRAGRVSRLPTPAGSGSMAFGMNSHGDVVGVVLPPAGPSTPVLWRSGKLIELGVAAPDISANPRDVNDAGLIVGEAFLPADGNRAIAWSADQPSRFSYVASPGTESYLSAVTETGTVVGYYTTAVQAVPATGTVATGLQALPLPAGADSAYTVAASGAYVAGAAHTAGADNSHATLWQGGVPTDLSKEDTAPTGVNSAGTAVGNNFTTGRAVVWSGGTEQPLPTITTGPAITSASVGVITETNAIGGWVNTSTGDSRPVVWHCR